MGLSGPLPAQVINRYNTFSYSVNEGLLQSTLANIEIDQNNFCWISFPNGIQKFDGNSFTIVPVQPGLPDDKYTQFFRCGNGDLLISHMYGISRYNIAADNFSLVYRQKPEGQKPSPLFIGEDAGVLYCFDESTGVVTALDCRTFNVLSEFKTGLTGSATDINSRLRFSDNIMDGKSALRIGSALYLVDLRKKTVTPGFQINNLLYSFLLWMKSGHEVLYTDIKNTAGPVCADLTDRRIRTVPISGRDNSIISRCVVMPWKNKMLLSLNNRLYETDSSLQMLKSELVNFQNQPVAGTGSIARIREDYNGNLYLQTVSGGIRKIIRNNYPVKYFGTTNQANNNTFCVLPDKKNNRILTGGSGGLFVFDTLQQLIRHFPAAPVLGKPFTPNGIIQSGDGSYYIFSVGSNRVLRLSSDLSALTPLSGKNELPAGKGNTAYFGNLVINNGTEAIYQTQQNLYRLHFGSRSLTYHTFSDAYIMTGLWYRGMIISHGANELIFLDGETFRELKKLPLPGPNGVRCFAVNSAGEIHAGGNKGIFKIDTTGKVLRQWNISTGLPDECIYAMAFDKDDALWCSTNKGIFRLDKNNMLLQITREDGLQENEFNTNVVAAAADGELYFGGTNGVSSFNPASISSFEDRVQLLFTGIKANNEVINSGTAPWNTSSIKLPYGQNSLSFDFIAMGNNNPGQYVYQYKMKGMDREWIRNSGLQTVRYSLSPGSYTLQLYASRSFSPDAVPAKEIDILIRPPYWRTLWFRAGIATILFALVVLLVNNRNRRKYARKLQVLENEKQLKQERERISKDLHDSLGAYANAVLYHTERLEHEQQEDKRQELIGDLKFASKDIITSLRETVWALRKDKYSAEECFVRIRNFIQPLPRYYPGIRFIIEGEAPEGKELTHTRALNLVRIVQEAVSNSIKHAGPSVIRVSSQQRNGSWQVEVQDDGTGFNYESVRKEEPGNGLGNMEQRAAESGFTFTISSGIKSGTLITVIV